MDNVPVFFSVDDNVYRLRFPALLDGFDGAYIEEDPEGRFDAEERDYYIKGYQRRSVKFEIRVSEMGSDLQPARIEAWFTTGGKAADFPADLRDSTVKLNEAASKGRTLIYINGKNLVP